MSPVQGRDGVGPKSLGDGDHTCVHRPKWQIAIPPDELGNPQPITGKHRLGAEIPAREIAQESHLGLTTEARCHQVSNLGDNQLRNYKWSWMYLQQVQALRMMPILRIDVRVQWPGINDQRYRGAPQPGSLRFALIPAPAHCVPRLHR